MKVHLSSRVRLGASRYASRTGQDGWIVRLLFLRLVFKTH
jgi:hypothetical protein